MTPEAFSKRLAMGWSSVGPAWGSDWVAVDLLEGVRNERPVIAQESRHEQKSLTVRRAGRGRSIHTDTAHAGALWGARDRVPDKQRFWVVTYWENSAEEPPRLPHRATKWFKRSLHDLSRDWYRWLGVRGCGVRSGMSFVQTP